MKNPIVELQGDEMTRIIWDYIKEILLVPFVDLNLETYDLSLVNRDETEDKITVAAANAIKRHKVGVKCATITSTPARQKEYKLKALTPSPNAVIRAILDGTVFRTPVIVKGIKPFIPSWTSPITLARHAYGDVYKSVETLVPDGAKAELVITAPDGATARKTIHEFKGGGIVMSMHNTDASITSFARACFKYAVSEKRALIFGAKDTISKTYDGRFRTIFQDIFDNEYKGEFERLGITYEYNLIDDVVARVIRSNGGFIWACKNYDGDVMSDMVATVYGSLAMMTSVLVSPDGCFEFEAAHGTVTRHYYKHLKGEETSTNSIATLFAWTGALAKRGELDGTPELCDFAAKLERAAVAAIEGGIMTGDLVPMFSKEGVSPCKVSTREFLEVAAGKLLGKPSGNFF
jgi:isocitrate dehydrogenase